MPVRKILCIEKEPLTRLFYDKASLAITHTDRTTTLQFVLEGHFSGACGWHYALAITLSVIPNMDKVVEVSRRVLATSCGHRSNLIASGTTASSAIYEYIVRTIRSSNESPPELRYTTQND